MIHLLATGGTIAGEADPEAGGARYRAGYGPVGALLDAVPGLAPFALSAEQVLALDSKDMTPEDWLTVLAAVRRALANPAVDGVVILHGTDTLEETAYFLQLTLPAGKPVVLTGAMRPADHPQADGPANLLAAVRLAASPEAHGKGVLVVMNATAHAARHLVKARTTGLDAFESAVDLGHRPTRRPLCRPDREHPAAGGHPARLRGRPRRADRRQRGSRRPRPGAGPRRPRQRARRVAAGPAPGAGRGGRHPAGQPLRRAGDPQRQRRRRRRRLAHRRQTCRRPRPASR